MTIWLIGGTRESAELAKALVQLGLPCLVTVVTESARGLYPEASSLQVEVGRLTSDQVGQFLHQYQIDRILDASHPFAVDISQLAINASTQHQIPYLRYERPVVPESMEKSGMVEYFDRFETLLSTDRLVNQRVLLTIGYRTLHLFQPWQSQATLFVRILPSVAALEAALTAGFSADRIIALRPPVSVALEIALWQQWQLTTVVTKASGSAGGEDIKHQVAATLGVHLIVIDRPSIVYPQETCDLENALAFCHQSG